MLMFNVNLNSNYNIYYKKSIFNKAFINIDITVRNL